MLLIAPDSFKGTFSAAEVATALASGLQERAELCPLADGGEGTLEVLVGARRGWTSEVRVHDPLGRPVTAALGWMDGGATAIAEMASASGLGLVPPEERDAEEASTFGTGELIVAAKEGGARKVVVAVGGSATTDGGAGAIEAIEAVGGLWDVELVVLCDVTTAFEDAARVYAPQKGADAAAVERLSKRLEDLATRLPRDPRRVPRTGAAGGLSGGLWATYGAALEPGAAWVLDAVEFDARLARADAVITGEGRLDRQTFEGKLVGEVAARCRRADKPVHAVVGSSRLDAGEAAALGLASVRVASDEPALVAAGIDVAAGAA
jgi:glycerate 2-kinase